MIVKRIRNLVLIGIVPLLLYALGYAAVRHGHARIASRSSGDGKRMGRTTTRVLRFDSERTGDRILHLLFRPALRLDALATGIEVVCEPGADR